MALGQKQCHCDSSSNIKIRRFLHNAQEIAHTHNMKKRKKQQQQEPHQVMAKMSEAGKFVCLAWMWKWVVDCWICAFASIYFARI